MINRLIRTSFICIPQCAFLLSDNCDKNVVIGIRVTACDLVQLISVCCTPISGVLLFVLLSVHFSTIAEA